VGPFMAGQESAGVQRVVGVTQALRHAGHEVLVGGQGSAVSTVDGVRIEGFTARIGNLPLAAKRLDYGVAAWLEASRLRPDLVITYGGTGSFQASLRRWARSSGVPRIVDSVEWYDRRHLLGGAWGVRALDNEASMRWRYPRHDGVIAISSLLECHYSSRCGHILRVPPLMDVRSHSPLKKSNSGPLVLLYAGTPGRKDKLGAVVRGIGMVDPHGDRVRLEVVGTEESEAGGIPDMPSVVPAGVRFHGRVTRDRVLEMVALADYVPLLRPNERYANAGFPTKVVEAMAVGTPVIANLTSDLGDHIMDGKTGLVCPSSDAEAFAEALKVALKGGRRMSAALGAGAREEALRAFDFRQHAGRLSSFVEAVRG
jgi:glycosyltransferase involved in cell wall biosynthesis